MANNGRHSTLTMLTFCDYNVSPKPSLHITPIGKSVQRVQCHCKISCTLYTNVIIVQSQKGFQQNVSIMWRPLSATVKRRMMAVIYTTCSIGLS